jgi:hypothetical protein
MLCAVEMFGGVFVLRRVAAAYLPALKTHAEVNPSIAAFNAFFAFMYIGFSYLDLIEMGAFDCHRLLLFRATVNGSLR